MLSELENLGETEEYRCISDIELCFTRCAFDEVRFFVARTKAVLVKEAQYCMYHSNVNMSDGYQVFFWRRSSTLLEAKWVVERNMSSEVFF